MPADGPARSWPSSPTRPRSCRFYRHRRLQVAAAAAVVLGGIALGVTVFGGNGDDRVGKLAGAERPSATAGRPTTRRPQSSTRQEPLAPASRAAQCGVDLDRHDLDARGPSLRVRLRRQAGLGTATGSAAAPAAGGGTAAAAPAPPPRPPTGRGSSRPAPSR